ncbi:hypothetical protein GF386_04000, partial [Candidatus Pacearchaeota archaeon]|nr:hypothetical protein [Candidatus Pacearchaeota archaeon]
MLKLKEKLKEFKIMLNVIENLTTETDVVFKEEEIFIRAIHPSNHCFIIFNINKNMFEEYNIKKEITYTLNISLLNKILKKVGKNEVFIKAKDDRLYISGDRNNFRLNYFVGSPDQKLRPDIQTTSKWKLNTSNFFTNITELLEFSEIC